jgi:hypothetical protein
MYIKISTRCILFLAHKEKKKEVLDKKKNIYSHEMKKVPVDHFNCRLYIERIQSDIIGVVNRII